jgi:hypothetical protein
MLLSAIESHSFAVEAQAIVVQTTCNAPGTLPVGCTGTGAKPCQFCQQPALAPVFEVRANVNGEDISLCAVPLPNEGIQGTAYLTAGFSSGPGTSWIPNTPTNIQMSAGKILKIESVLEIRWHC